jgi:hypothetical protein
MRSATITRCSWASVDDPLMLQYHDHEWGVPVHKGPDAAVAGSARMTGKPEIIGSSVGLVPRNALVLSGPANFPVLGNSELIA